MEVGCHFGISTALIDPSAKIQDTNRHPEVRPTSGCLGVDVGPNIIKATKSKFPHVLFKVGNCFKMGELVWM